MWMVEKKEKQRVENPCKKALKCMAMDFIG
jgi:hypothetical protein